MIKKLFVSSEDNCYVTSSRNTSDGSTELTCSLNLNEIDARKIKFNKVVLELAVSRASQVEQKVFYTSANQEYLIDVVKEKTDAGKLFIDVTDEYQDALNNGHTSLSFKIEGNSENYYSFGDEYSIVHCEYTLLTEDNPNSAYLDSVSTRAGSGKINLDTGMLKFGTFLSSAGNASFPIELGLSYNQNLAYSDNNQKLFGGRDDYNVTKTYIEKYNNIPGFRVGKGWKLGPQQYLVKNPTIYFEDNNETSERFTWIDAEGNEVNFDDKYYYLDENDKRCYVKASEVTINADQTMTYQAESGIYDVTKECVSETGFVLSFDNEKIKNIDKFNTNAEEINSLKKQIESIEKAIKEIKGEAFTKGTQELQFDAELNAYKSMLTQIKQVCLNVGHENTLDKLDDEFNNISGGEYAIILGALMAVGETPSNIIGQIKNKLSEIMNLTITAKNETELSEQRRALKTKLTNLKDKIEQITTILLNSSIKNYIFTAKYDETNEISLYDHYFKANSFIFSLNETINSICDNFVATQEQYEFQNGQLNTQISNYTKQKEDLEEQLDTYLRQYPTHVITSEGGSLMLGFAKTDLNSQLRLVMIADKFDHYIFFNYDRENKLVSIIDSFENVVKLDYEKDYLKRIVDSNGEEIEFSYDNNNRLYTIAKSQTDITYYYNDNGYLIGAYNSNDIIGVGFEYLNEKVTKTFSMHRYKSISGANSQEVVDADILESERVTGISKPFFAKNKIEINYYDYQTTIVTDETTNKRKTYQFDNSGKLISEYDNDYVRAMGGVNPNAISYQNGSKVSFEASTSKYSIDYAENCELDTEDFVISDFASNIYTSADEQSLTSKKLQKALSAAEIQRIKDDKVTCLVLSGWAKADSAWINARNYNTIDNSTTELGEELANKILESDSDRADRRFELRVELTYSTGSPQSYYCSYDWMNTDWQYCAVPVRIGSGSRENLTGVKLIFDYSKNYGLVSFFGMQLREGEWSRNRYYNNKIEYNTNSATEFDTSFSHDKDGNLQEKSYCATLPGDEDETYFNTQYYHDPQGKLTKTIDSDGIVTEYVYDSHGNVIKELVYHKDEPANKFVTEREFDEHGVETTQIGALGEKTKLAFDKKGNVKEQTDALGNKISFGFDEETGEFKNLTATANGEPSSNENEYVCGLLVKTSHNGCVYEFEYDGEGRKTKVKINGENYCTITYDSKDIQTITYANGEIVKKKVFADGDRYDVFYAQSGGSFGSSPIFEFDRSKVDTQTDIMAYKEYVEDRTNGAEARYKTYYDKKNRVAKTEASLSGYGKKLIIKNTYGFESALTEQKVEIDGKTANVETRSYEYGLNNKLTSISHKNAYSEQPTLDKLGRISGVKKSNGLKKAFKFVQKGERATNLVASETFGEGGKTKEKLSYTYNKLGNITEIRKDGELVVRYSYDELNRLVREDNRELGKSFFTSYDSAGNITERKECDFTLDYFDNLEKTVVGEYEYADSDNKDRLLSFNGEECLYDSLGRPSTYRGNDVEWTHVNRLAEINGATFKYNYQGVRLFKTFGDKTTKYFYDGAKLLCQENEADNLFFFYGTEGVTAFRYDGAIYHYKKDMLGNILGIYDENNNLLAKYVYDAWGNHKTFAVINGASIDISDRISYTESDNIATKIAILNPFRYRSYYFDIETGYYYLQSRYYDPQVGRFLSPDSLEYLDPETIHGLNLFAYCANNPVMAIDPSGNFPLLAFILAATALVGLGLTIGGVASDNNTLTAIGLGITGVAALGAGGLAIAGAVATGAIATGVIGGVTAVGGLGSLGFMSAEIQEATGNGNWIMDSTGMSEGLYNGLLLGTASIATLGSIASFGMLATNPMTGFTHHGWEQALLRDGHGVSRKAILNAVKHPLDVVNQGARGIKYVGKLATVVLNSTGKVITTWATTSAGWRNIIILCFILGLLNNNKNY